MSSLDFLSPGLAASDARWTSPLERALAEAPAGVLDLSRGGKLEVRGDAGSIEVDAEVVRITPERALVLCDGERAVELRDRLAERFVVTDVSAGLAGLEVRGEALLRRLTDLDLDGLPAAGAVAHVPAVVVRDEGDVFRLYFPQEYGHHVAEVVIDALEGLR